MKTLKQIFFSVLFIVLLSNAGWGQQVIGSFPSMDGGYEGQTTGNLTVLSSIATGVQRTDWTVTNTSGLYSITSTGGRSGPKYVSFTNTSMANRRLQSPTADNLAIANTTAYTVQFFYKSTFLVSNGLVGISPDGSGGVGTYVAITTPGTSGSWSKLTYSVTSGNSANVTKYGVGIIRFTTNSGNSFDIDDYVIYDGPVDNNPPNSPGSVTVSSSANNSMDISWGAASGGVDGGGYVVVRYAVSPNADNDPNQNGIYALNNIITNGTGSLEGTVRYIGTGTNFTDNSGIVEGTRYYYKVYTVDKAFNYSTESTGNDVPLPVSLSSFSSNVKVRDIILSWTTENELNNSGFEVQRSVISNQLSDFTRIGFIEGKGTKNTPTSYSFEDKNLQSGKYKYRLKQIDHNGNYEYFELSGEVEVGVPNKFDMSQNYPNPFNPVTKINFDLPENGLVNIRLYDMLGREVAVIVNEVRSAGYHTVQFDASKLSSGIYFYKMSAGKFNGVKKMSVLK